MPDNRRASIPYLPKIKVCGVTCIEDLVLLQNAGIDSVGINLVPNSKRFVPIELAIELACHAKTLGLTTVAVVMDPTGDELNNLVRNLSVDFIQLHGHEPPTIAICCEGIPIVKAVAWSGLEEQENLVQQWTSACGEIAEKPVLGSSSHLAGFLLDAHAPGVGGGTGQRARWDLIFPRPSCLQGWRVLLAGGLTPENVNDAIGQTRADGVDTASGVELSPGRKSAELVTKFAEGARRGFSQINE